MLETFEAKKPFYPLISFSVSVIVLIFGMLFSKNLLAFAFATAIFVLYSAFGLFKSTWKMTVAMAICGLIIGGLSFLTNKSLDAFWQTLLRMILLGLCAVPMVSTSPCDLTRCLAKLKCPRVITLGMLVTLKFIPVLVDISGTQLCVMIIIMISGVCCSQKLCINPYTGNGERFIPLSIVILKMTNPI